MSRDWGELARFVRPAHGRARPRLPEGLNVGRKSGSAPVATKGYRNRMRQRRIPEDVILRVYDDPDGVYASGVHHAPDREIRWRRYDDQVVEIVVEVIDDTIVSAWITRVDA